MKPRISALVDFLSRLSHFRSPWISPLLCMKAMPLAMSCRDRRTHFQPSWGESLKRFQAFGHHSLKVPISQKSMTIEVCKDSLTMLRSLNAVPTKYVLTCTYQPKVKVHKVLTRWKCSKRVKYAILSVHSRQKRGCRKAYMIGVRHDKSGDAFLSDEHAWAGRMRFMLYLLNSDKGSLPSSCITTEDVACNTFA